MINQAGPFFAQTKNFFKKVLTILCAQYKINVRTLKKGGDLLSPPQGRPPIDDPKTERLFIRVTPKEKQEIQSFAKSNGFSLLELIKKGIEAVKNK